MSRERLSINSLTSTPSTPREPFVNQPLPPPQSVNRESSTSNLSDSVFSGYPTMKSADSPTSSSSTSYVSPPQYEYQLPRYPSSKYTTNDFIQRNMHRQISPTDPNSSSSGSNHSSLSQSQESMSLDERRKRNKAASAKYRAKKQIQISQMSKKINSLTEENNLLQERLQQVCDDNNHLRAKVQAMQGRSETDDYSDKRQKKSKDDHNPIY
ncbi:unnamed protein product [Umbelopsis vinacea]